MTPHIQRRPHLEIRDLIYDYPCGRRALSGVNLSVARGRRVCLLGPNGAGKSTLLCCLNGTVVASGGSIALDGTILSSSRSGRNEWRQRVGLVFQQADDQVIAPTVDQDIAFGLRNLGYDEARARHSVEAMAERLGIQHLLLRSTHDLSHGERKKVVIAGVLVMKPDVLLLDEPTDGLDAAGRYHLMEQLYDIQRDGITIIAATHDLEFARRWSEECVVIKDGRTLYQGASGELFDHQHLLVTAGLAMPP